MTQKPASSPTVLTIGHSTRPLEEFIALLRAHDVRHLMDVRTVPRSRHNPQFNRDTLPAPLETAGIGYSHVPALGGLRHADPQSINVGWRNASFRGYADHMQTPEFSENITSLVAHALRERVAIMCAEAVPWRCHRSLIADAVLARGVPVGEITSASRIVPHALTSFAKIDGTRVTYPQENALF